MVVLRKRNRLVSFRMSEDEYQRLCSMCTSMGARSISDLARTAVERMVGFDAARGERQLAGEVRILDRSIRRLQTGIEHLASRLDHGTESSPDRGRLPGATDDDSMRR